MAFGKGIASGADLSHPKATPRWVVGALIALTILIAVGMIAYWLIQQAKTRIAPMVPGMSAISGSNNSPFGEVL